MVTPSSPGLPTQDARAQERKQRQHHHHCHHLHHRMQADMVALGPTAPHTVVNVRQVPKRPRSACASPCPARQSAACPGPHVGSHNLLHHHQNAALCVNKPPPTTDTLRRRTALLVDVTSRARPSCHTVVCPARTLPCRMQLPPGSPPGCIPQPAAARAVSRWQPAEASVRHIRQLHRGYTGGLLAARPRRCCIGYGSAGPATPRMLPQPPHSKCSCAGFTAT